MQASHSPYTDSQLIELLARDDVKAFEYLFRKYYKELCHFCVKYVNNKAQAEEIVSGMFTGIWEKRHQLHISTSVKAYLYTSVKNTSLNYLKSQYARGQANMERDMALAPSVNDVAQEIEYQELQQIIGQGVDTLPPKCRIIFNLSRNAGMSYEEIALELGISKKTVKAQMGIALHKLKTYVGKYWGKILVVLIQVLE